MTITDQDSGTPPHPPLHLQPQATPHAAGAAGQAPVQTLIRHTRRSPVDTSTAVPVLDVTIPVYNEERDLEERLRRLHAYLRGTFPHSFRITVADNASTDGALKAAERVARELREVTVVHLAEKGRGNALRKVSRLPTGLTGRCNARRRLPQLPRHSPRRWPTRSPPPPLRIPARSSAPGRPQRESAATSPGWAALAGKERWPGRADSAAEGAWGASWVPARRRTPW